MFGGLLALGGGLMGLAGAFGDKRSWQDYYSGYTPQTNLGLATGGYNFGADRLFQDYNTSVEKYMAGGRSFLDKAYNTQMRSVERQVSSMTPTMATFRGYAAAGGAPSGISNVIAATRAKAAQKQGQETVASMNEQMLSTYQRQLADLWGGAQSQAMQKLGLAQGAYEKQQGMGYQADWTNKQFAANAYNQAGMFNAQQMQQAKFGADKYQSPWQTMGFGLMGMGLGSMMGAGGNPNMINGVDQGSWSALLPGDWQQMRMNIPRGPFG